MKPPTLVLSESLEPVDTLGDTSPGAFDDQPLLQHPAIAQADADLRVPGWVLALGLVFFLAVIAISDMFRWGFAPAP